jgi:tetratricopeptide (TPR) repeat protein
MEAGAIALEVFAANPEHPGAAHYVIHAFDDPTHAILAMDAAVAYGAMAPDAAHAQHMTSHIFLARGMWDEVVEANVRADAVVDRGLAARGAPTTSCGHYNQWLSYGFQQEGRAGRASELVLACAAQAADEARSAGARASADFSAGVQRAWYLADTEQRGGPVARLRSTLADPGAAWSWGNGFVAARSGEIAEAQTQLAELRATVSAMDSTEFMAPYAPVWIGTLQAEIARANGDPDRALGVARAAADYEASLPVDFGPPLALKPAREVEAEVLLELERYAEAASAFDRQLQRTPRRVRSLLGSATAHLRAGNTAAGLAKFETLANVLDEADEGFGPALQARSALQGAAAGAAGAAAGAAGSRR